MKINSKKICGFFGMALVLAITVFAVNLPTQDVKASDTTSVTDTIQVRVINDEVIDEPSVEIVDVTSVRDNSIIYAEQDRAFRISYHNAKTVSLSINYTPFSTVTPDSSLETAVNSLITMGTLVTDQSSTGTTTAVFDNLSLSSASGDIYLDVSLSTGSYTVTQNDVVLKTGDLPTYGYGSYLVNIKAKNSTGLEDEEPYDFSYFPLWMDISQSEDNDADEDNDANEDNDTNEDNDAKLNLTFKYDADVVDSAEIYIYRDSLDGEAVKTFYLDSTDLQSVYSIDLAEYGFEPGTYYIKAVAKSKANPDKDFGISFIRKFIYEDKTIRIPDTGYFLQSIDASSTDILITFLVAFLLVTIVAIILLTRRNLKAYHHPSTNHKSIKPAKKSLKTVSKSQKVAKASKNSKK